VLPTSSNKTETSDDLLTKPAVVARLAHAGQVVRSDNRSDCMLKRRDTIGAINYRVNTTPHHFATISTSTRWPSFTPKSFSNLFKRF
jgi:hypothetical protein